MNSSYRLFHLRISGSRYVLSECDILIGVLAGRYNLRRNVKIIVSINVDAKTSQSRKQSHLQNNLPCPILVSTNASIRSYLRLLIKETIIDLQKMNQPPNFSPSTPLEYSLFSPSKAAEQQRLAKDWTYIHQFLSQKYPFPQKVPKFEENEETLKALLALVAFNEKGDEGWGILCGVERSCVKDLEEREVSCPAFLDVWSYSGRTWCYMESQLYIMILI